MNDPGTFDELARKKLEERTFTFEEEHWTRLQHEIEGARSGRRTGWIWFSAALLLLISGTTLVLMDRDDEAVAMADNTANTPDIPASASAPSEAATADDRSTVASSEPAASALSINNTAAPKKVNRISNTDRGQEAVKTRSEKSPSVVWTKGIEQASTREAHVSGERRGIDRPAHAGLPEAQGTAPHAAQDTGRNDNEGSQAIVASAHDGINVDAPNIGTGTASELVNQPSITLVSGLPPDQDQPALSNVPAGSAMLITTPSGSETPSVSDTAQHAVDASGALTMQQRTTNGTSDSTAIPPPTSTNLPMRKPHRWAMELSVLGGPMSTPSGFTPAQAIDSRSQVSGAWGSTAGGEFMLQWPHFGMGAGLMYTTLAERITSERLATSFNSINYHFNVQSIDTTLTVVTGTIIQDSTVFYTTMQKDTVLTVLTIDRDTITTEVQKRAAKETRNTVSYLEIPLLLDAHTSAGRFTFGLRGGPMVGLVQVSQGTVPNSTEDGYADLLPRTFRETVLGYQARLYVRYRLTTKLSVGVEPFIRGSFQNVFGNDLLNSRPASWGGAASLTWRF